MALSPKRKGKITGSIAAACISMSPYMSKAEAYRTIKGLEPPFEGNEYTQWGVDHEKDAILSYEAITGNIVDNSNDEIFLERDYLGVTPDGSVLGVIYIEAKCPQKIPESIPDHYMVQIQLGMELADMVVCHFIYWTENKTTIFEVERSKAYWDEILPHFESFAELLRTDTPPPKRSKKIKMKSIVKEKIVYE